MNPGRLKLQQDAELIAAEYAHLLAPALRDAALIAAEVDLIQARIEWARERVVHPVAYSAQLSFDQA